MDILDDDLRAPIATIEKDKVDILKYHEEKEAVRLKRKQFLEQKERFDAINTIKSLMEKWDIKPDEVLEGLMRADEHYFNEIEEPYGPDYSEEALQYSKKVHDVFGFDYECKECLKRPTCSRFSNFENLQRSGESDGIDQLLEAGIIQDIEYFYIEKQNEADA